MQWRLILLILVALGLLALAVYTWGSIGSALCVYCLITMGAALLVKKFFIDRDSDQFESE